VSSSNGDLKLEKLKGDGALISQNIPINAKFTILDGYNQSNISGKIKYNDDIILRSSFGVYLIIGHDKVVSATGHIIAEESIWKIIKPYVPYISEWNFKRKFLNYNSNSFIFNTHYQQESSKDLKTSMSSQKGKKKPSN